MDVLKAYQIDGRVKAHLAAEARSERAKAEDFLARSKQADKALGAAEKGQQAAAGKSPSSMSELDIEREVYARQAAQHEERAASLERQYAEVDTRMMESAKAHPWLVNGQQPPQALPQEPNPFDKYRPAPASQEPSTPDLVYRPR